MNKLLVSFALVAAAGAFAQEYQPVYHAVLAEEQLAPPRYAFEYSVHDEESKDIHSHKESRDGDKTEGEYSLVEPDGGVRTVKYHVDGNSGFIAEVIRSGQVAVPIKPLVVAKPVYIKPAVVQHVYQPQYVQVPTPASYVNSRAFEARSFNAAPLYNQRNVEEAALPTTTEMYQESSTDEPARA
ncbi:Hypothetical predicted protein [Cloeon dipterum]|uniref:Cuticle protein n=1 Tax=Cloeon dipterum TaxID=197152 RepID=A0A8S1DPK4_9INSE|nr:Hypothetical predicted protein [Cloeon dipterum]